MRHPCPHHDDLVVEAVSGGVPAVLKRRIVTTADAVTSPRRTLLCLNDAAAQRRNQGMRHAEPRLATVEAKER